MSAHTDNPYAFPGDSSEQSHDGMRLRDYFAAKAMQGDLSAMTIDGRRFGLLVKMAEIEGCTLAAIISREAYEMADAMLATRNK